jgi:hypothetical protein
MSLIACTSNCMYQKNGRCTLDCAGSLGEPTERNPCVHFRPQLQDSSQSFPDVFHGNEL